MLRTRIQTIAALLLISLIGLQSGPAVMRTAGAQDSKATPVASPVAIPATDVASAQEFVADRWRMSIVTAKRTAELPEAELDARDQRDWIVVIADVTNWSSKDATLYPRDFGIRLSGGGDAKGIAPKSTRTVAKLLDIEPTDIDGGVPLDQGQTIRVALVFQIDQLGENPALVINDEAIPLDVALNNGLPLDDLPDVNELPELDDSKVEKIIDGGTLEIAGFDKPAQLSFVDSPALEECYGDLSRARLERLAGDTVYVEENGDITYVWSEREDGTRRLLNFEQIVSGYAAIAPDVTGSISSWLQDGAAIAEAKPAGLWKNCTGPHGVAKAENIRRTNLKLFSGEAESGYEVRRQWSPVVVTTRDGTAWVFFIAVAESGESEGKNLLYGVRFDPGTGGWQPGVAMPGGDISFGAAAVTDNRGTVHVVYSVRDSDAPEDFSKLVYTREDGKGGWIDPVEIAPDEKAGHQISPSLAVDANGALHVLWQDQRLFDDASRESSPANADIFASSLEPGGDWSIPVLINFHSPTEVSSRPHIVADGDRLIALWSVYTSTYGLDTAARIDWAWRPLDDPLAWTAPEPMTAGRGDSFGGRLVELQADPTGGAVMVYARQGTETFLFLRRLESDQTTWAGDTLVAFGQRGQYPALTVNEQGTAYISFNAGTGVDTDIAVSAVPYKSVVVGPEIVITRDDPNTQGYSGIANDVTGKPIIVFFSERPNETPKQVVVLQNPTVPAVAED